MDAALRLDEGLNDVLDKYCFNPCFDGCRPATTLYVYFKA